MPVLNNIIVSDRPWHKNLANQLSKSTDQRFFLITKKDELSIDHLTSIKPRYIFFTHWSHIIPPEIYNTFDCVIFHMTDLPFGRGGSPLQNLIVKGIYQTKISALKCVAELDAGPIYFKEDFSLAEGSAHEIFERCTRVICTMILRMAKENITPKPQTGEVVVFKRRKPEQSELSEAKTVLAAHDFIRMLDAPGYPKAFLTTDNLRIEFSNSKLIDGELMATVKIELKPNT